MSKKKKSTKKTRSAKKKASSKKGGSGGRGGNGHDDVYRVFAIQAACRELELTAMSYFMTEPGRFDDVIGQLHKALRWYAAHPAADCMGGGGCPAGWCCDPNSGVCQHYCGLRLLC